MPLVRQIIVTPWSRRASVPIARIVEITLDAVQIGVYPRTVFSVIFLSKAVGGIKMPALYEPHGLQQITELIVRQL